MFALLIGIALALFGVDIVKPELISSQDSGGAGVFVVSITYNWFVVIPLAAVFLFGFVCLAISFHANRVR